MINNFKDISWGQKLFNYINNINIPQKCICGSTVKFYKFGKKYMRLGFTYINNTEPKCWYYNKNDLTRKYKPQFNERDYLSIYDCGEMNLELVI